ncbi:MAG TPA: N-methyl-L-tryptophan oxidase [Opitutus sp.]|nr:N-methyl-L-tryptophan oxidase [Opitutus sp.]
MPESYDVAVVGLGAMGSAVACHLARRGQRVLGLDRFRPPHTNGSSHGQTRIIREAYFEDPLYVPLVQRAYELWAELENRSGRNLLETTGGLMIGRRESAVVSGARRSAELHRLPHEVLTAAEVIHRFPALRPADDMVAVWEPRAGVLFPEACIETHLALAQADGAELRCDETVTSWQAEGDGVTVTTSSGRYHAGQLLLTAGSWIASLVPELARTFTVERQVLYWFQPRAHPANFSPDRCPIHIWEAAPHHHFYGCPDFGHGVKVAFHHQGETTHPDRVRREVDDPEIAAIRKILETHLPDAAGPLRSAETCLYTNTADEHFWINRHPQHAQVLIASPCSGHGFKFSSVIGEILADLLTTGNSRFDLSLFGRRKARAAQSEAQLSSGRTKWRQGHEAH